MKQGKNLKKGKFTSAIWRGAVVTSRWEVFGRKRRRSCKEREGSVQIQSGKLVLTPFTPAHLRSGNVCSAGTPSGVLALPTHQQGPLRQTNKRHYITWCQLGSCNIERGVEGETDRHIWRIWSLTATQKMQGRSATACHCKVQKASHSTIIMTKKTVVTILVTSTGYQYW